MATVQSLATEAPAPRTSAHLRPLDSVLIALDALEETPCQWCHALLTLIKAHLEATEIPTGWEVLS